MKKVFTKIASLVLTTLGVCWGSLVSAQCEINITLTVTAGTFPSEIGWSILDGSGAFVAGGGAPSGPTVYCVSNANNQFVMTDSFGDGWNGATFTIQCAGSTVATGTATGAGGNMFFSPGVGCTDPLACNWNLCVTIDDGSCCIGTCAVINMFDSFGDGWDGGQIYIITELTTNTVVATGNLPTGSVGANDLCLPGGCLSIEVTLGAFSSEISWSIPAAGIAGGSPAFQYFSLDGSICIPGCMDPLAANFNGAATIDDGSCIYCPPGEAMIVINMFDSFGDGWNNGGYVLLDDIGNIVASGSLNTATFGNQFSAGYDALCLPSGCYFMVVTGGIFPAEITWNISDTGGNVIIGNGAPAVYIGFDWGGGNGCIIYGCTDSNCNNYNVYATIDDGSCECPPVNDDCADGTDIACGSSVAGTFEFATADGLLGNCGVSIDAGGVWYDFVGTGDQVTLTTCNSLPVVDTKIHVFTGGCGALTCFAANDDACAGFGSTLTFTSINGTPYQILVSPFGGPSVNDWQLDVTCQPCPGILPNDDWTGAFPIFDNIPFVQNICCANPDNSPCLGFQTGYGVWYAFNACDPLCGLADVIDIFITNVSGANIGSTWYEDLDGDGPEDTEVFACCPIVTQSCGGTTDFYTFQGCNTVYMLVYTLDPINCGSIEVVSALGFFGCTDPFACNYDPNCVTIEDGSCLYTSSCTICDCDVVGYDDLWSPCMDSVCSYDPFCCDVTWDGLCAAEASTDPNCAYCLAPPVNCTQCDCGAVDYDDLTGPCADSVCALDPFCCATAWDGICAGEAAADPACAYCIAGSPVVTQPDCSATGYDDLDSPCAASVCAIDPFCCATFWDGICTGEAAADPACAYCIPAGGATACTQCDCSLTLYNDLTGPCATSVCALDPFCCGVSWDGICAGEAVADPNCAYCLESSGCTQCDCGLAGYNDLTGNCADAVCAIDPFCCATAWDAICAGEAAGVAAASCGYCLGGLPGGGPPCTQCDCDAVGYDGLDSPCAASVCLLDPFCCATAWDAICAGEAAADPACAYCSENVPGPCAQCNCDQVDYDDLGSPCADSVCALDPFCCATAWDGICAGEAAADPACAYCLGNITWWLNVTPDNNTCATATGLPCDTELVGETNGGADGLDWPGICPFTLTGCDCTAFGWLPSGPCATSVCSYDPFCCDVFWDGICTGEAASDPNCAYCAGLPCTPNGVWYQLPIGNGDTYTVYTCGSTMDTQVDIYAASSGIFCAVDVCVAQESADFVGCGFFDQDDVSITFISTPGWVYYAYVQTEGGLQGLFDIGLDCEPTILGCMNPIACNYEPTANWDDPLDPCDFYTCVCADLGNPLGTAVTMNMTDFFGDGWDLGQYTITDALGNIVAAGSCDDADYVVDADNFVGCESAIDLLCLDDGCYTISVGGSNFNSEISWFLEDELGNILASGGAPTVIGFSIGGVCGCTNPAACNFDPAANVDDDSCCLDNCLVINMFDSFGDGWDGSQGYTVLDDGGNVVLTGNLLSGVFGSDEWCLPDGCYTFIVDGGFFPSEISWEITDNLGNPIMSGGAPFDGPLSVGGICGCTNPAACNYDPAANVDNNTCCFDNCGSIIMIDSFGDGWNGGIYVITDNLTGLIVTSGGLTSGSLGVDLFCLPTGCYNLSVGGSFLNSEITVVVAGADGPVQVGSPSSTDFSVGGGNCDPGCHEPFACNYDPTTGINDCTLCEYLTCQGCTYLDATNYDALALIDNGSCLFELVNPCPADLDGNGVVNVADLLLFMAEFGTICPD